MNRSLKLYFLLFITISAFESSAQTFGIKAGLNISNILSKDNENIYSSDYKIRRGFHFGVTTEIQIGDFAAIDTGLLFSTNGYKTNQKDTVQSIDNKLESSLNLFYFNIPLALKVWHNTSEKTKIYGVFGSYVGMGLSGKKIVTITSNGNTETVEEDIKWGLNRKSELKRLDYGAILGVGMELNAIQIGVTYRFGMANISNKTANGFKFNNRTFEISVGYKFL